MKNWFAAGLLLAAVFATETSLLGQDNTESLQKEVTDLKREVELLKRERDLLTQELKMLKTGSKGAKPEPAPEGEINGTIWEIIGLSPEGKPITPPGQFHALDGKVYVGVGGTQVGTYTDRGPTTTMDVFGMPNDRVNGRYQFIRVDANTFKGTMRNLLGNEHPVLVRKIKG